MLLKNIATTGLLLLFVACADDQKSFDSTVKRQINNEETEQIDEPQSLPDNSNDQVANVPAQPAPPSGGSGPNLRSGYYAANMTSGGVLTVELKSNNNAKARVIFGLGSPNAQYCDADLQAASADANSVIYNMILNPNNSNFCAKRGCRIKISTHQATSLKAEIVCEDLAIPKDEGILQDCKTVVCA